MRKKPNLINRFWKEVKRRKVHRVLAIYAGTAFIILEAVDIIFPRLGFPDWSVNLVLYLLIIGAIITLVVSWIYDITPGGIVKTAEIDTDEVDIVFAEKVQKRQKTSNIIIAVLVIVVGVLLYPKIFKNDSSPLSGTKQNTIAVLPLKVIGTDSDVNYFAIGLVESLTHMLTKLGNSQNSFSVIPASEIIEPITALEAKKLFGASLVISGSLQIKGNTSRFIMNLIDTKNQHLLKSEKLDYIKDDDLILQDEIISEMIALLGIKIESKMYNKLTSSGSRLNEANELFLKGRGILRNAQGLREINDAIELFKKAVQIDSLFSLAYAGLGQALSSKYSETYNIKWINEAIEYSKLAVKMNDQDPYILLSLGRVLSNIGNYQEAEKVYHNALDLDPYNTHIYIDLGWMYQMNGEFELAEENIKKAISLQPDNYRGYSYLGVIYIYSGHYEKAIVELKNGLQIAPENQYLLNSLAACYRELEEFTEAIQIYDLILQLNSNNTDVLTNIGTAYYYEGNFEKSIEYYRRALDLRPLDYRIHGYLADALYWCGDKNQSKEVLIESIELAKEHLSFNPDINLDISSYYQLLGIQDSAKYYLERRVKNTGPESSNTYDAMTIGELYLHLGEKKTGLEWIESALRRGYGWIQIKYSPWFKDFKNDPEFQAMLKRAESSTNPDN